MAGDEKLHVVMFPWLAFGHMIPYLELSKFIAIKGYRVSFISTPRNIQRLPKLPPNLAPFINLVKLPLPHVDGLPDHAEATTDVSPSKFPYLKKAFDGLEPELTRFLQTSAPDWIIYDFAPYWLPPIAGKLGISSAFFLIINAWFMAFLGPATAMIDGSDPRTEPEHFTVRPKWVPFPSNVAYRLHEAKWMAGSRNLHYGVSDLYRSGSTIFGSDVIVVRHCREFEPDWLKLLEDLHQKPILPVGLMPPTLQDSEDENNETWLSIGDWLDQQNSGSVVYVALGSEVTLSQEQLTELSLGLELSGLPFFWALRKPAVSDELDDPLELPGWFVERTKGRGVVWTSWVPQLRILAHEAVGGFLTHCGWSSTIEGLQFGHPLVMLPFLVDQGLNARVLEEKKVGVEIPRDELDGSFTRNSVADSLKLVMVDDEGKIHRERAKEMRAIFGDKDLHDKYMDNFVEFLENRRRPHEG